MMKNLISIANSLASAAIMRMLHSAVSNESTIKATVTNPRGIVEKLSTEGTVIPLGPKDFQQLLRLPDS